MASFPVPCSYVIVRKPANFTSTAHQSRTISKRTTHSNSSIPTDPNMPNQILVERINEKTKRTLDIETSLAPENLAKCDPQLLSPFFTKLPPEVRDMIWRFASTPCENASTTYSETAYYYRPGNTAHPKISTSHLQTCRLAWLESNAFPLQQTELSFWLLRGPYDEHRPRFRSWQTTMQLEYNRYRDLRRTFTKNNLEHFASLRLFVQMFELERLASGTGIFEYPLPGPSTLHITIRSSDWWDWESNVPLRLDEASIRTILETPRFAYIDVFKLELETIESKKEELEDIIGQLEDFVPAAKLIEHEGKTKTSQFIYQQSPKRWDWTRSPRLDELTWSCFEGLPELRLHVVEMTWRNTLTPHTSTQPDLPPAQSTFQLPPFSRTTPRPPYSVQRPQPRINFINWRRNHRQAHAPRESFPEDLQSRARELAMWDESVRDAMQVHDLMKHRFDALMGALEADRLRREWREKGTLLKFVEDA